MNVLEQIASKMGLKKKKKKESGLLSDAGRLEGGHR
jgi:hypothetical protein